MTVDRRKFLQGAALVAGASTLGVAALAVSTQQQAGPTAVVRRQEPVAPEVRPFAGADADWESVRDAFALTRDSIHMSAMLLASHPRPVREAIARHRDGLDADTVRYLEEHDGALTGAARDSAADYLRTDTSAIALTRSTTHSVGLAYNGLRLGPEDEILTTEQDYFVTYEATRLAASRSGATLRRIPLYDDISQVGEEMLATRIVSAVQPQTRVVALTWVHSDTGLKLPLGRISAGLAEINTSRPEERQVLLCVDAVHGFGIENVTFDGLGVDMLMAGCHKWLFGPRGTGIIAASPRAMQASRATIPSFLDDGVFQAWLRGTEPSDNVDGAVMTPGGFRSFEHCWALPEAFAFHESIGRDRVEQRTHALALMLKEGLSQMPHVTLATPISPALSSGIVSFNVDGFRTSAAVRALREREIIASAAPYATPYVRLTPSIRNSTSEIEAVLQAVHELG